MNTASKAYRAGYSDGLAWDLDGFESLAKVVQQRYGWDESTINAMGRAAFSKMVGAEDAAADGWDITCAEYNAGVHGGACVSQGRRTGKPPQSARVDWNGRPAKEDKQVSDDELRACFVAQASFGRMWKSHVRRAWEDGNYDRHGLSEVSGDLQRLRNRLGPAWLNRFVLGPQLEYCENCSHLKKEHAAVGNETACMYAKCKCGCFQPDGVIGRK